MSTGAGAQKFRSILVERHEHLRCALLCVLRVSAGRKGPQTKTGRSFRGGPSINRVATSVVEAGVATQRESSLNMISDTSPSPKRAMHHRAPNSGRRLSGADAALVKALLAENRRQQDLGLELGSHFRDCDRQEVRGGLTCHARRGARLSGHALHPAPTLTSRRNPAACTCPRISWASCAQPRADRPQTSAYVMG